MQDLRCNSDVPGYFAIGVLVGEGVSARIIPGQPV